MPALTLSASGNCLMPLVARAVRAVGTLIMDLSVVGEGVILVKKLGVTVTAAPTPVTVMATGSFVVCVERVVGVTVSDEKVNGASAIVDVASGVFVRDVSKGNTSGTALVEPSVVLERFPVPRTMDPLGVIPLRFEVIDCLPV